MTRTWRRALWLLPLLVLVVTVRAYCGRNTAPSVQTVAAKRAPLRVVVSTNGKVEPVDDIEVRARLDGRVVYIPDPGKVVAAGDEMVRFDDGPVAGQVAAAESDRLAAIESLRVARATAVERQERWTTDRGLEREGALTRDVLTQSERAAREAAAQVEYLQHDVPLRVAALDKRIAELRAQQQASAVRAPFAGTIYKTQAKKGEMVRLGDPLLWLADLEHLRVRANVDQVDLGRVRPGQPVRVTANAFQGRAWTGTVSDVVPNVVVKESRSVSEGLARLDPPTDGLVPGMTVDVEIVVAEDPDTLQVPAEAVQTQGRDSYVYRVDGKRLHKTAVRTGLSSVSAVAIAEGLDEGALVVVGPIDGLEDGMRVRPERRDVQEAASNAAVAGSGG
jgi:HlyD family secretion protein